MSHLLETSALHKRWFHMPSFAVIALAGASTAIAYKGIDAWREHWLPAPTHAEPLTTQLVGRGVIGQLRADHIEWTVTVNATGKRREDADRILAERSNRAVQQLLASGVAEQELRLEAATVDSTASEAVDSLYGLAEQSRASTSGYNETQIIRIHSTNVPASLRAYANMLTQPPASIDIDEPECWVENTKGLRERAQEAAWADLDRQASLANTRTGSKVLGRVVTLEVSDVTVAASSSSWACEGEQEATATVSVTYDLR